MPEVGIIVNGKSLRVYRMEKFAESAVGHNNLQPLRRATGSFLPKGDLRGFYDETAQHGPCLSLRRTNMENAYGLKDPSTAVQRALHALESVLTIRERAGEDSPNFFSAGQLTTWAAKNVAGGTDLCKMRDTLRLLDKESVLALCTKQGGTYPSKEENQAGPGRGPHMWIMFERPGDAKPTFNKPDPIEVIAPEDEEPDALSEAISDKIDELEKASFDPFDPTQVIAWMDKYCVTHYKKSGGSRTLEITL